MVYLFYLFFIHEQTGLAYNYFIITYFILLLNALLFVFYF